MKVSKPMIILCVALLLLAVYIQFFTGKKKPKGPVAPVPPAQTQAQTTAPQQGQPPQAAQPAPAAPQPLQGAQQQPLAKPGEVPAVAEQVKPQFDKLNISWAQDPFMLPKIKGGKRKDSGSAVKLVAIMEKGNDRVAVIDRDVVKKGDMVGNEKVVEIGVDRVVLARGGAKRTLLLADFDTVATEEALATKSKATERAK